MHACWKRWCLGAVTAWLALASAFESGALAAQIPAPVPAQVAAATPGPAAPTGQEPPPLLDTVARHLGVPAARLESAVRAAELERWNAFASAHHIPEERAKEVRDRIAHEPVVIAARFGNGGRRGLLGAAASYLGMQPAELMTQLRDGKSLADVAQARGKSTDGLKAAVIAAAKSEFDQRVQSGQMTAEARDRSLAKLQGHVDELIQHRFTPSPKPMESGVRSLKVG